MYKIPKLKKKTYFLILSKVFRIYIYKKKKLSYIF